MKHPFIMLLHYSWLFALAMAILFQIRCLAISKILKKEYSVTNAGLAANTAWFQNEIAGKKEIKYLMQQLRSSRALLKSFFVIAVIIFVCTRFM